MVLFEDNPQNISLINLEHATPAKTIAAAAEAHLSSHVGYM